MKSGDSRPILVTGGGGFLGSAIVRLLREQDFSVRILCRRHYPELDPLDVLQLRGDVADRAVVDQAVRGCQTVFHVAAKAGLWGPRREYYATNVTGTKNVLHACRRFGVPRLIFTSSPSVVFNGCDLEGVDESVPYAVRQHAAYPATKALAEQAVLAANDRNLATIALRPHLIWGPGDNNILPRLFARARAGRLYRIGRGNPLIDLTYIDNAAEAHLLAADRLEPGSSISGRPYFIAQGQPVPLWDMVNRLLEAAELPPVTKSVPLPVAMVTGAVLEAFYALLRIPGEPRMTRFLARELSTSHWYNLEAARRDLGYSPRVDLEEGLRRLAASLKARNPRSTEVVGRSERIDV
jgi:nucleoside-diphosphate-sugar epimerase